MSRDTDVSLDLGDLRVVVRAFTGIYDLERHDGRWLCSCGQAPTCSHVAAAEAGLEDVLRP